MENKASSGKKTAKKKVTRKKAAVKKTVAKKAAPKKKTASRRKAPVASRVAPAEATPRVTEEQIRERAFEIFRSGRHPQDPDADWYDAVRELSSGNGHSKP